MQTTFYAVDLHKT